jgi:hypothetical protein
VSQPNVRFGANAAMTILQKLFTTIAAERPFKAQSRIIFGG